MPTPDDYNNQPGYRNFNAPPGTPGYFTVANPTGGPPLPGRTTESSTRNGNPQATQTAAAPPPADGGVTPEQLGYKPGMTPEQLGFTPEEIAGARARGMIGQNGLPTFPPGTVKFNSQGAAYNPARVGPPSSDPADPSLPGGTPSHPGEYKFPEPEPAAKPLPNLGHWTPDQAAPWMHVKPIAPQQVPDRPPDTHVGTRPAYHPRPTEAGYTPPIHQPGQPYSFSEQLGFALQAGFTGPAAYTAAALGMAESKGNAGIVHYNDGGKGYNSYGLMQINGSNDAVLRQAGINGAAAAVDPLTSYKAAYVLSKGGTDFSPWSTFNDKSYLRYLDGNARPEASSTLAVGPRQNYRPPPGREPGQWGAPVSHDWTPGNMPTAHDIPGILGALLPIAIAGVLGGGGLGMIAAYAGYQNARNKAQTEEAKQQKTLFQDRLKETEAGLKEELLEASGLWAQYGDDYTSPAAQQAWAELAAKYGDTQLRAALESGGKGVEQLFKKRDEAFQTIGKVSAATTKADEQEAEKRKAQADEGAMGFPETPGTGGGTGAPAGPEKPWENAPIPQGGPPTAPPPPPGSGGPAAGTPPGGAPAVPAAAPTPPSEQPTPEGPPPSTAPPGTPSETLPPVSVTAPAEPPPPPPAYSAPRTPFDAMVSQIVNGEEVEKFKPAVSADGLKKLQAAAADKINRIEAVKPGPDAAAQLKAIDPTFGSYAEGVAHYNKPDPTSRANVGRDYVARMYDAAQKINPQWTYQNFKTLEDFRESFNPEKPVGMMFSRTSRLADLSRELADDATKLPNTNVATFNQLIGWFQGGEIGDKRYTKFINDWRLFANDAQAIASGTGKPPVTLTSHLIDTLRLGAKPDMIRQGLQQDVIAALASINSPLSGWHRAFQGEANPFIFDQRSYAELNQYAHMNVDTGALPEPLPDVGYSEEWGGQRHYYLGGDITNKLNWSLKKPPGDQ